MKSVLAVWLALAAAATVAAHAGPPYPIVMDRAAGPYTISIWTDPDATDDGSPGGQFWVVVAARGDETLPPSTAATVTVQPLDRQGGTRQAAAAPVRGDPGNQFAAIVMDHEGRYAVAVTVSGPLGMATIEAQADATYDLRPPPYMLAWYLLPFLLAGLLWGRLLLARRKRS